MPISLVDSSVQGLLFGDAATAACFDDRAVVAAMVEVERALARVEGRSGVIPAGAAAAIDAGLDRFLPDPASLTAGTASAGVPIPALVAALRDRIGGEAAAFVHWGATSQDVIDTALVLRLRDVLDGFEARIGSVVAALTALAREHRDTPMAARTRSQQATPITFGLKVAGWALPLHRHRTRLAELRARVLVVQFGGASGNLAALDGRGVEVMEALAAELGLRAPPMPWHAQRDPIAEVGTWLSLVSGALGKMGGDLVALAQSEVGEVRPGAGGGSSTMPQKVNPIAAEALVSLARQNAQLLGMLHDALVHVHERDGVAWNLEWFALPQMAVATGAALGHAERMATELEVLADRMRANLRASNGLMLAEAASFALARHMPRPAAQALVKAACAEVAGSGRTLVEVLQAKTDAPLDWSGFADEAAHTGEAGALVDRVLAEIG